LLAALALSGAAGLTYQVLWLRLLSLVFGVTAYAASTVLAGFMAGLALGSAVVGPIAGRAHRPLRTLAIVEAAIGVAAIASAAVLHRLPAWYAAMHAWTGDDLGALTAARFVGAFLILLIPTSLMGATLPLVAASWLLRGPGAASRIGGAYAANTAGAIAGALLTGFYLIGGLGITAAFQVAATANLAAAAIVLWLSRHETAAASSVAPATASPAVPAGERSTTSRVRRAVLAVLAVSGLASLALEVIWFRILVLFVPATTYAFTIMLAAVLGGISAGSWLATPLLRRERDWIGLLARIQAATGLVVLLSMAALAWTFGRGWRTSGEIQASVLAIFPAAALMGLAFPIALKLWSRGSGAGDAPGGVSPRDLGAAYAVNVAGAIVGAIVAGFLLLPRAGSRASLVACAALYVLSGLLLAWVAPRRWRAMAMAAAAVVLFVPAAMLVPDPYTATLKRRHGGQDRVLWHEEGVQTTVSVHGRSGPLTLLFLNGLHQASDSPEMLRVHREIGHLPMVLHADPRRALVIGLGGGATAGAVSQHAGTTVDVVELSDSVRRGAEHFVHANYGVLDRPNVRVRVDDGRNFLLTTDGRYDVLTADIIQPVHAGAGLLYSVEYYRLARAALDDDGLMLQWVGHRPETQYKLMVRSFMAAFPETSLWADGTLLIGSRRPLTISRSTFERQRRDPAARAALDAVGLDSFERLLSRYVAGPSALRAFVGPGDVLSDDRPRLEFHRSLPREGGDVDLSALRRDLSELRVVD
jgi:spermidine synthase